MISHPNLCVHRNVGDTCFGTQAKLITIRAGHYDGSNHTPIKLLKYDVVGEHVHLIHRQFGTLPHVKELMVGAAKQLTRQGVED